METGLSGCPFCGRDENHERYLQWEEETEKWARKYRSGKLKDIPQKALDLQKRHDKGRNPIWQSGFDEWLHPAIRGYLKFQYEDMSLLEFINAANPQEL